MFYINITKKESLKRALGRRVDGNVEYHLDTKEPPVD